MKKLALLFFLLGPVLHGDGQTVAGLCSKLDSLQKLGQTTESLSVGEQLFALAEKEGVRDSLAFSRAILQTIMTRQQLGQYEKTEPIYALADRFIKREGNLWGMLLANHGDFYAVQNLFAAADSVFGESIAVFKKAGREKSNNFFKSLAQQAQCKLTQSKLVEAEALFQDGLNRANLVFPGDHLVKVNFLYGLGRVFFAGGKYRAAEEWVRKSIEMAEKVNPPGYANLLIQKNVYVEILLLQADFVRADSCLRSLMADFEKYEGRTSAHYSYGLKTQAVLYNFLGNNEIAAELLRQKLAMNENQYGKNHPIPLGTRIDLAELLAEDGQKSEARAVLAGETDSIFNAATDTTENLGIFHNIQSLCAENVDVEISELEEAVAIFQKTSNQADCGTYLPNLLRLTRACLRNGQPEKAAHFFGFVQKDNEKGAYQFDFEQTKILLAAARGDLKLAAETCKDLAATHQKQAANDVFLLNDHQQNQRMRLIYEASDLFCSLAEREKGIENLAATALDFQLFSKSFLLSAARKIRQNIQSDTALATVFAEFADAREQLAWAYGQSKTDLEKQKTSLPALEARADSLEKTIARSRSDFASAGLREPFSWRDVRARLRGGEAALEIARFREFRNERTDTVRYAIFIITPEMTESPALVFLPDGERFEQILLEKYLSECAAPGGKGRTEALFETIWQPLEPFLKNTNRVFVSSDGAFHKINLAALRLPDGSFLGDKMDIRPVFSLRDIGGPKKIPGENRRAFLAGNPAFSVSPEVENGSIALRTRGLMETDSVENQPLASDPVRGLLRELQNPEIWPSENPGGFRGPNFRLLPLPGSQKEVEAIAALLQKSGWQATVVTGESATETAVKSVKSPRILHLATHGYFLANERSGTAGLSRSTVQKNPMLRSMLFFAGAQNTLDAGKNPKPEIPNPKSDDGVFTAYEAQNIDLEGTELVVLSACQTAQGKLQNGEGVYGLQRALRIAGAQSLLLSLWDVDDAVGREFMLSFYKKWLGGMDKAEAFRAAQLSVKARHPEPFYWAGFVLVGQ